MSCGRSQGPLWSFKPQEQKDILIEVTVVPGRISPGGGKRSGHSKQSGDVVQREVKQPGGIQGNFSVWLQYRQAQKKTGEGGGTPLQYCCLENPMDGGAWWAAVHGVAKSRTRLSNFTFTFHSHTLEKEMATHSSTLAWKIPWRKEPGGLQSMGTQRVRHE